MAWIFNAIEFFFCVFPMHEFKLWNVTDMYINRVLICLVGFLKFKADIIDEETGAKVINLSIYVLIIFYFTNF